MSIEFLAKLLHGPTEITRDTTAFGLGALA